MCFYQRCVVPWMIHRAMRNPELAAYRARSVPAATGRVLEIGIGPGMNLPYYGGEVSGVLGLDPSAKLLALAREKGAGPPLELIEGSAEAIPLADRSVDTVMMTWTLCSIPDPAAALREMRRVLQPSGRLLFVEHGRAPEARVAWWQDTLTPMWKHLGGCHLNRAVDALIEGAGFRIERLDNSYMRGPKPMTFMYEGSARVG